MTEYHFDMTEVTTLDENKQTNLAVTHYTKEDFLTSEAPYNEVYVQKDDPFMHNLKIEQMTQVASSVGVKTFKGLYKNYVKMREMQRGSAIIINNPTQFSGPYLQLDAGRFNVDDGGVYTVDSYGSYNVICHHPIIPFECLRNIDTGEEKLNIAFRNRGEWRELIVSKEILYNSRNISQLVKCGVDVSSETAKDLVSYFQEIENLNRHAIPLKKSVGRLGYIGEGFSPYVSDLTFDGEQNYSHIFKSISQQGDYKKWLSIAKECRKQSLSARIFLAAAFASVLIEPLGGLPFFVHLWGVDSGTGKTVALMLAASVWGCPDMGEYIQTFNSTVVGHEKTAAFLNSLPFLIDELQLSKDSHGKSKFDVYQLAQGVGRTRGTKTGGIERTPTWRNTILTTGESPLTSSSAGAGAVNRVIDIECSADKFVVKDGMIVSSIVKQNYGFAGKKFVEFVSHKEAMEQAKRIYNEFFEELCQSDTTEKQAMAAAMILTADTIAEIVIFEDGIKTNVAEMSEFLKSKKSVSTGERGYRYMCDWVASNNNRFRADNETSEIYGTISDNYAYIISSKFRESAEKEGYSSTALLSWLKSKGLILTRGRRNTRGKRIGGVNSECVVMKLPEEDNEFCTKEELAGEGILL